MKNLIKRVWEYSKNNPHGFTLNIETFKPIEFGFCVAYEETQDSFGIKGLELVIEHSLKHNKIVGGWLNEDNGMFYFDSVKVFKFRDADKALKMAYSENQLAIVDLTYYKEIKIKDL